MFELPWRLLSQMLIIRAMEDIPDQSIKKGDEFRLYIVDAHHHMGREGDHKNTPPGAYEFYAQLWFELQRKSKAQIDDDELLFKPVRVVAPDYQDRCFSSKPHWNRMNHGWLVDRTIAFPYTDDYFRTDYPSLASFHTSNEKIASWTTRAPHSTRLIGFARVDPHDAENISNSAPIHELEHAITQLGLRGLKLHPLAQLFIDDIESEVTKSIIRKARDLGIPVLFDTRNIKTVLRIKGLIDSIRDDDSTRGTINGFSIILAHCGMSPGDVRLHDVLNNPIIFADTSTLHGKDVPLLFKTAKDRITTYERYWSQKFLFGTDYSFLSVQALDVILYLLSREFPGTLSDIQLILGGNALQLIQKPIKTQHRSKHNPKRLLVKDKASDIGLAMLDIILASNWELASLDYMIPPNGTWPQITNLESGGHNGIYFDSYLATLISENQEEYIQVWVQKHSSDYISCSFLNSSNAISLSTCELATQRIDPKVRKELSVHESIVHSQEELISIIGAILQE
jgi:predicted TIM-barrel fold metal-dependent hydrolase